MGFEGINPFELLFFPWSCVNVVTLPRRMSASHPFVDHNHFRIYVCVVHEIRWVLLGRRGRISLIVPDIRDGRDSCGVHEIQFTELPDGRVCATGRVREGSFTVHDAFPDSAGR